MPDHVNHFSDLLAPAHQHYHLLSHQPTAYHSASQHGLFTQAAAARSLAAAQGPPYPYHSQAQQYQQLQQHSPYHTPPPPPAAAAATAHQPQALPYSAAVAPLAPYGYSYPHTNQYQLHQQQQQQQQQQQHSGYPIHSQNQVTTAAHHHAALRQQQHMSERQLRSRNSRGRKHYADEEDDDDYEMEDDDEPESSDSAHESSSSRRQDGSPSSNAAAAAAASGGRGNTSIKTAQRWTQEEHDLLLQVVTQFGNSRRWSEIAKHIPGRTGKQCRERWVNHMNPNSKKGSWDVAEELMLCKWHSILGSHWAKITRKLEGRTENAVKNHWNAAMRAKLPMRRHTPLNMYVSHIRTNVEPSDALVKVLEALQEQHPDLVAETARAAADIVQRRLNPSSAAAVAASAAAAAAAGGGQQQGMLPLAAGGEGYHAVGSTAAPSTPAAAAAGLPLQQQHLTEAQQGLQQRHSQQLPYFSTEAVLLAAGSQPLGEFNHQQQPQQQHLMGLQQQQHSQQLQQQQSWVVPASAAAPIAAAAGITEQPSVAQPPPTAAAAAGGDAAADREGTPAKRARLSSGASGASCGTSPREAGEPGPAAAEAAARAVQPQQQQQQETAAAAMLHSPNMTSSNSNTSCHPGAPAGTALQQQQQQSQCQQQQQPYQQPPSTQPAVPLQQQQQVGTPHAAAAAAAHTAAAARAALRDAAIKRGSQHLLIESLVDIVGKCEQLVFDLDIGKFLEAQQQEKREQQRRNKQLLRQQSAPVPQHYQQQQQQQVGRLPLHHSDPSMPTAASAPAAGTPNDAGLASNHLIPPPAPLQLYQQQQQQQQQHYSYHLDQLQQQATDELLAQQHHHHHQQQQQQQRGPGMGGIPVPRRPTYDESWLARYAPVMANWSTPADSTPGSTLLDTLAAAGPNTLPPTGAAAALLAEQQQQHEHRYREITTAVQPPQQLQQTPLQRSHSEVVHSVATNPLPSPHNYQLPDWTPLQTGLPSPQQHQYPYQQQQQQLPLGLDAGTVHMGEAALGRFSDQGGGHGNLLRSLSAPTAPAYRPGAEAIGQLLPAGPPAAGPAAGGDQPPATTSMLAAALARTSDFGQGPRSSAAGGSAGIHVSSPTSTGLPATSQGVSAYLDSTDLGDLAAHDLDGIGDMFQGSQG